MSKIKTSELFYSIQGEGRYQGVPSIFLRTFGCNFTCSGFGMPKGEASKEVDPIADRVAEFTAYDQLPLVSTGCDSFASWHPAFKHLSPMRETSEIAEDIANLLPFKEWRDEHLVITGGEPLLGWQRAYPDLLTDKHMFGLRHLTFETNGTQELSATLYNFLNEEWKQRGKEVTFSVSAKLSCSGESRENAIRPEIVKEYQNIGHTYLKFVVATNADVEEALEVTKIYRDGGFNGYVYLMPIGGVESVYALNNKHVAELAMKHGLRYSDRLQVPLFANRWGT